MRLYKPSPASSTSVFGEVGFNLKNDMIGADKLSVFAGASPFSIADLTASRVLSGTKLSADSSSITLLIAEAL